MSLTHTVATQYKKTAAPLAIKGLSVAYQKKPVLRNVSFEVNEGELVGVIGPNGAGKSTLMKAALGLIPSLAGEVLVYGKPYKQQRKIIGYVPQRESVDWDFPTNALCCANGEIWSSRLVSSAWSEGQGAGDGMLE